MRKQLSRLFRQKRKNIINIEESDILLVSYPRSGNTWLRHVLANLLEPQCEWHIDNINRIIPDIHEPWPVDWIKRSPRIMKSHFLYQDEYKHVIYIYRDGRDVAVSYFDFVKKLQNYQKNFDAFLESFLLGELPYGAWHNHVESWLLKEQQIDILFIQYETMVADPMRAVSQLENFIGLELSETVLIDAIARSSFSKIQRDYQTRKHDTHWQKGFRGGVKGGPGKWREVFTPQNHERFWEIAGAAAKHLGYSEV